MLGIISERRKKCDEKEMLAYGNFFMNFKINLINLILRDDFSYCLSFIRHHHKNIE